MRPFSYGDPHPGGADLEARKREARIRLAGYLRDALDAADRLFLQGSQGVLDGLARFDGDAANILATQRFLAEGAGEPRLAALARDFANLSVNVVRLRLDAGVRMAWHRAAVRACQFLGDRRGEGRATGNVGIAHFDLAEYQPALECFRRHLDIATEVGDVQGQANAHSNVGSSLLRAGRPGEARAHFKEYLRLGRQAGDRVAESKALCNLGVLYESEGDLGRALAYHEASARAARDTGDRMGEARALNNMGGIHTALGEPEKAIRCLAAGLAIGRELGHRLGEANSLGNLGNAYARLGEHRTALGYHAEQLRLAREIRDRRGEGNALWNMALAESRLGGAEAVGYARAALTIFEAIGHELAPQVRAWLSVRGPTAPQPPGREPDGGRSRGGGPWLSRLAGRVREVFRGLGRARETTPGSRHTGADPPTSAGA